MFPMRVTFVYNWDPKEKVRGLPAQLKSAVEAAAKEWHQRFLPEQFTQAGASSHFRYPRRADYNASKLKRKGHTIPLVFSGALRDACEKYRHFTSSIQGGAARVTALVRMNVGFMRSKKGFNYATSHRKSGMNLQDEISDINASEAEALRDKIKDRIMLYLRQASNKLGREKDAAQAESFGHAALSEMEGDAPFAY